MADARPIIEKMTAKKNNFLKNTLDMFLCIALPSKDFATFD